MGKEIDIIRARRETPGCENVVHLNNAGASLMPTPVLEATKDHLDLEAAIGGYEAAAKAHDAVEHVYQAIGRLLNCGLDEIAVIENATRAWDMAFYSIPFTPGDIILTSAAEYASNYIAYLQVSRKTGARIVVVPNEENGQISIRELNNRIDKRVKIIAITHVPTNGGLVNPAADIGQIARRAGILYLLDACQSVGQMPIDVREIGCDFLSATGRKYLRGPRGTGFLFVRREAVEKLEPPFLDLHAARWSNRDHYEVRLDARRFENWETYYAGKIGLGVAVDYALAWGLDQIRERVSALAGRLRARLTDIPKVRVLDVGAVKCGIVSFDIDGHRPEEICLKLAQRNFNAAFSLREYTRLDMEARGLESLVRASVHYYNTEDEIDRFCHRIREIVSRG